MLTELTTDGHTPYLSAVEDAGVADHVWSVEEMVGLLA